MRLSRVPLGRLLSKSAYKVDFLWDKWLLYKRFLLYKNCTPEKQGTSKVYYKNHTPEKKAALKRIYQMSPEKKKEAMQHTM